MQEKIWRLLIKSLRRAFHERNQTPWSALMPSHPDILPILVEIREKFNIPETNPDMIGSPKNKKLTNK